MRVAGGARTRWLWALALVVGSSLVLGMAPARSDPSSAVRSPLRPGPISRPELRDEFLALTNADRRESELGPLELAERLSRYATRHSRRMSELGYIFHSGDEQLRGALEGTGWAVAGENVGVGPALEDLESAFMASRPHRHNVLGASYDRVAVGVVESGGVLWITVVFYGD